MITERQRTETYYVTTCMVCGKEFEVPDDSVRRICHRCEEKKDAKKALDDLAFLVGAKITAVTPVVGSSGYHMEEIAIVTRIGVKMVLRAGGWGDSEPYIEYETADEET